MLDPLAARTGLLRLQLLLRALALAKIS